MTAPVTLALTHTPQQDKITVKQISSQPAAYKSDRNLIYDAYENDPQGLMKSVVRPSGPSDRRPVATRTFVSAPLACVCAGSQVRRHRAEQPLAEHRVRSGGELKRSQNLQV